MKYLSSVEGHRLGLGVSERGEAYLNDILEAATEPSNKSKAILYAACQLVGIAAGIECEAKYWCGPAHRWLFASGYEPDAETRNRAAECLIANATDEEDLHLAERLKAAKKRGRKLPKPSISVAAFRKSLKARGESETHSIGTYGEGVMVGMGEANSLEMLIEIGYFECEVHVTFVLDWLRRDNNFVESLQLLCLGCNERLTSINIVVPAIAPEKTFDRDKSLTKCLDELCSLKNLQQFSSNRMFVDDSVVQALCASKKLTGLRVEPPLEVSITAECVPFFAACPNLECVIIESNTFGEAEAKQLLSTLPDLEIAAGTFVHGFEE